MVPNANVVCAAMSKWVLLLTALACLSTARPSADPPRDAKPAGVGEILTLFHQLWDYSSLDPSKRRERTVSFDVSADLVNTYVRYLIATGARSGVSSATISFKREGNIGVEMTVDLEQLKLWNRQAYSKAAKAQEIRIRAIFVTDSASQKTCIRLLSVSEVGGRVKPNDASAILQTIGQHQPEKFDFSKPVPVPFGLRTVRISDGMLHASTF